MGGLTIQCHDFENAKKEIKNFSEQTITNFDLNRVKESKNTLEVFGDFCLGRGIGVDHNVTGEELNALTSQIQTHLISINNTQIKLINEFGQVYLALEALDKDYIQAILISIKAIEETSQSNKNTQGQIKQIVEKQKKTLEELKKFKQRLDGYAHLKDIDNIWNDCQKMAQVTHLTDVDAMWKQVEGHQLSINKVEQNCTNYGERLNELAYVEEKLTAALQTVNATVESLILQIRYAYWIAGGSAGLAIIVLILLLMKVI